MWSTGSRSYFIATVGPRCFIPFRGWDLYLSSRISHICLGGILMIQVYRAYLHGCDLVRSAGSAMFWRVMVTYIPIPRKRKTYVRKHRYHTCIIGTWTVRVLYEIGDTFTYITAWGINSCGTSSHARTAQLHEHTNTRTVEPFLFYADIITICGIHCRSCFLGGICTL